jgi:hypothetical protein
LRNEQAIERIVVVKWQQLHRPRVRGGDRERLDALLIRVSLEGARRAARQSDSFFSADLMLTDFASRWLRPPQSGTR